VGASVSERGNVQTCGGNRVSTISLLDCSTSVALAMGPTDEEEEVSRLYILVDQILSCNGVTTVCCTIKGSLWVMSVSECCVDKLDCLHCFFEPNSRLQE